MTKLGLRGRFVIANLAIIILVFTVLVILTASVFESYEKEYMQKQVAVDLDRLGILISMSPGLDAIDFGGSRGLVVSLDRIDTLPALMRDLPKGIHDDFVLDGREYIVGRRDVDGFRHFVLLDMQSFEEMEALMIHRAVISLISALAIALFASLWMSRQVLKPVSDLSNWLAGVRPGQPRLPFTGKYGDRHIDGVAAMFEDAMDRLEAFVGREQALTEDVSHELRTPISVARSAVTLLLESQDLSTVTRQRIERIERATQQMEELVEAILFLAREDGGSSAISISLNDLVLEVIDSRRDAAVRAGATLHFDCQSLQAAVAHRGMALSIVGNVVDNAIRHGGAGEVVICLRPGELVVTDRGPGISPEHVGAVFNRKTRGDGSRGYGLGLHIVRNLCERLGWTINLTIAMDGVGTIVTITYPVAKIKITAA